MMFFEFHDNSGNPGKILLSQVEVLLRGPWVEKGGPSAGGFHKATILTKGGHRIETLTDYNSVFKAWDKFLTTPQYK